jgi:lysozyme
MKINAAGLALIKRFEGCRLEAYQDAIGVWTIGWGHTGDVTPGQKITQHQADTILEYDLGRFEEGVEKLLASRPVTENQFAALVSFAFNCGLENLAKSTLLRTLNPAEFLKWNHAGGRVLPGLTWRRGIERDLFVQAPCQPAKVGAP